MEPLKTQAIQTALIGDWNTAVSLNQTILQEFPDDIDTLNRLAFAYTSIGNTKEAKSLYQKVLTLDAQNPIALRNLKRLSGGNTVNHSAPMNNIFIEEPGKTKVVELINVAEKKLLSRLRAGEHLHLVVKRMKIFVQGADKQYLGMLPDDIGRRLIDFINGGNEYTAFVKTIDNLRLTVFIKEEKRSPRFKNQPSFPSFEKSKFSLNGHTKTQKRLRRTHSKVESADDEASL